MNTELYIQKNGKIALMAGRKTLVKAMWAGRVMLGDIQFLKAAITASVRLEPGITATEILTALSPWSEILGSISHIDIRSWLAAIQKLQPARKSKISHIELHPVISFTSKPDTVTGGAKKRASGQTGRFYVSRGWKAAAVLVNPMVVGEGEPAIGAVPLDDWPLSHWTHLPVIIAQRAIVNEVIDDRNFASKAPLFDRHNGALKDASCEQGNRASSHIWTSHLEASVNEAPSFDDVIVKAFLGEVIRHRTPADISTRRTAAKKAHRPRSKRLPKI